MTGYRAPIRSAPPIRSPCRSRVPGNNYGKDAHCDPRYVLVLPGLGVLRATAQCGGCPWQCWLAALATPCPPSRYPVFALSLPLGGTFSLDPCSPYMGGGVASLPGAVEVGMLRMRLQGEGGRAKESMLYA